MYYSEPADLLNESMLYGKINTHRLKLRFAQAVKVCAYTTVTALTRTVKYAAQVSVSVKHKRTLLLSLLRLIDHETRTIRAEVCKEAVATLCHHYRYDWGYAIPSRTAKVKSTSVPSYKYF